MTRLDRMQADLNKMWKKRKKGKVSLKFMTTEEKYNQFMETIGDRYSSRVKSEEATNRWRKKAGKGPRG